MESINGYPNRNIVMQLRKAYPAGTIVELVEMDDFQAPPVGTRGEVTGVDDIGSIMVEWATGGSLSLVYGVDKYRVISRPNAANASPR